MHDNPRDRDAGRRLQAAGTCRRRFGGEARFAKTDQPLICSIFARFIHEKGPGRPFLHASARKLRRLPSLQIAGRLRGAFKGARLYESGKNRANPGRSGAGRRSGPRRQGSASARSESRIARVSNRRFARRFAKESPATAQLQGLGSKKRPAAPCRRPSRNRIERVLYASRASSGTSRSATMLNTLIMEFSAGPAVSL